MKPQMDERIFSIELCSMGFVSSRIFLTVLMVLTAVERKRDLVGIFKILLSE